MMPPHRLLALAASPVYYQVPIYRRLAESDRIKLDVVYVSSEGVRPYDAGFGGTKVTWDEDLLAGYSSRFLRGADRAVVTGGFGALRTAQAAEIVCREKPDALWVHGYMYASHILAISAARATRIPVMIREEQTLLHRRPAPKRWFRELALRALFRNAYGLYIGSANREFFIRYGIDPEKLFFTPYCVDNDRLRRVAKDLASRRREFRRSFGIDDERPVVLFVGKLDEKKRPFVLLDAYHRLRQDRRCALLLVGDGPLRSEMEARVAEMAVPDVTFTGFLNRSQIGTAFVAADVFSLPSGYDETWGLVVNEAMNFGLPVVASRKVGSTRDLVRPGINGAVVPEDDPEALARALAPFLDEEAMRRQAGHASREIIRSWNYDVTARGIEEAVLSACRHG